MKKFVLVCIVLFIANIGCKKSNIGGGGLCACSPIIVGPELYLVIKNNAGEDLLNTKTTGAYTKDKIELYRKDETGKVLPIAFFIRLPFDYGNEKFAFNQLYVGGVGNTQKSPDNTLFLKLGDNKLYQLNLTLNQGLYKVEKVLIDNKEAEKDNGTVAKYLPIFYLTE